MHVLNDRTFDLEIVLSSDKEQLIEEEDDELKEVLDLRKIAVQLLQQEQQNRCVSNTETHLSTRHVFTSPSAVTSHSGDC